MHDIRISSSISKRELQCTRTVALPSAPAASIMYMYPEYQWSFPQKTFLVQGFGNYLAVQEEQSAQSSWLWLCLKGIRQHLLGKWILYGKYGVCVRYLSSVHGKACICLQNGGFIPCTCQCLTEYSCTSLVISKPDVNSQEMLYLPLS